MNIGELVFQLGFRADTLKLQDFVKAIGDLNMGSIMAATRYGAVYEIMKKSVDVADDLATGLGKFSRETDQSTDRLQQFSLEAEKMGVSAGTVESAIRTLQQSIFRMQITGEGSNIWNMLGLDPRQTKDKFELLSQLREKFKGMSIEVKQFYLQQLGLSQELLNLFAVTDQQWADINRNSIMANDQIAKMNEFHRINVELGNSLKMIWVDIGALIVPIFKEVEQGVNAFAHMTRESWGWKGSLDTIADIFAGIKADIVWIDKNLGFTGLMKGEGIFKLLNGKWALPQNQGGWMPNQNNVTIHNSFDIKSTDPHKAAKETEDNLKRSINDAYFSRSNGEH